MSGWVGSEQNWEVNDGTSINSETWTKCKFSLRDASVWDCRTGRGFWITVEDTAETHVLVEFLRWTERLSRGKRAISVIQAVTKRQVGMKILQIMVQLIKEWHLQTLKTLCVITLKTFFVNAVFLYIIVGPAHYYGNNGHLREKDITLQLCMPENDVAGLWTYLHCSTSDRSYWLTNRLENRLLIPNDNSSLWGRPLLGSSNQERLSNDTFPFPYVWGNMFFFSLLLSREHLNGRYFVELTATFVNNLYDCFTLQQFLHRFSQNSNVPVT